MPPTPSLTLRPASQSDIPRLTQILISSFPADPEWTYRFPHATQFPEDHYEHTFRRVQDYYENASRRAADMVLVEIDTEPTGDPIAGSKRIVVGFAAWQLPGSHGTSDGDAEREMVFPATSPDRRDADQRHVQVYSEAVYGWKRTLFDGVYGERQGHLCLLGVDPEFQGRGAGGALVEDGMEKARVGGYVLTLFATGPGGRRLYARKGFREVGWVRVGPLEGEVEALEFPGMVWGE